MGAIVHAVTLLLICVMAFSVRLFSVVKYESVIHEFDPYFNYRVTQFLTKEGFYNLWNWFDDRTWYPLGRVIGGTVYPVTKSIRLFVLRGGGSAEGDHWTFHPKEENCDSLLVYHENAVKEPWLSLIGAFPALFAVPLAFLGLKTAPFQPAATGLSEVNRMGFAD